MWETHFKMGSVVHTGQGEDEAGGVDCSSRHGGRGCVEESREGVALRARGGGLKGRREWERECAI